MKDIIISGSTAYDYIIKYKWNFKNESLDNPGKKLNVSFLVEDYERETGWTGLNIAYNMALLLDEKTILLSSIWSDFKFSDFIKENVNINYVHKTEMLLSATSHAMVDSWENQIIAFYPGAMENWDKPIVRDLIRDIWDSYSFWIVSPNKKEAMMLHLEEMYEYKITSFFDPGQQLSVMTKKDLENAMIWADYLIINEVEYEQFKKISEKTDEQIIDSFDKIIITYSSKGSKIISSVDNIINIPAVINYDIKDYTWAWDAYRAWLLVWLKNWNSWEKSAKLWAILSSYCLWTNWAQNHYITSKQIKMWFLEEFAEEIEL